MPLPCQTPSLCPRSLSSLIPAALVLLALTGSLAAQQQTTSTDTPIEPPQSLSPNAALTTLNVTTRRVVVDIVVTDPAGKPVSGLTQPDFKVFENGKPQEVRSFESHASEAPTPIPHIDLPANTFSNLSSAPQSGPVTVVLYDLLNTPLDSQPFAHAELLKFLKQRKQAGQVAIFVLSDKLHMLQGFTDDDNALIAALNSQKGLYKSSSLQSAGEASQASSALSEGGSSAPPAGQAANSLSQSSNNPNASTPGPGAAYQSTLSMLQHMETMETSYLTDHRVDVTVEALEEISRFLIGLPGRKNLLWMSASFPAGLMPNPDLGGRDSFETTRNYTESIMKATDLLNLAHVAVYPVDIRGLQVNPMFSAASNPSMAPNSNAGAKAVSNFNDTQTAEHSTMNQMADETGGRAFYNTNGLTEAAQTAVLDGSIYYTLSYSPSDPKFDGSLQHVRVDLLKPGYHLAYRRNYFADNLDTQAQSAADSPNDPLKVSLEHGAPTAHELFFEAHLQTRGAPAPASPDEMAMLLKYEAMYTKNKRKADAEARSTVMMQHYIISYAMLARQLGLTVGADGVRRGAFELAVMAYDDDGSSLDGVRTKIQDAIPPDRYQRIQQNGYDVIQIVNLPVAAASLRIAVRDVSNNHLGTVEIRLPLSVAPS
jgi:VWFA-related protein